MIKNFTVSFLVLLLSCSFSFSEIEVKKFESENIEVIKFQVPDKKFPKKDNVLAQIHFPQNMNGKVPLIIHQHGSERDGIKFKKWGGKTDAWGSKIITAGLERGYAVAVIDAFYKRGLTADKKTKFPNPVNIALKLGDILSADNRVQSSKMYYTGFSFGADWIMMLQGQNYVDQKIFTAVVAAEPGCNALANPVKSNLSTLIIKGTDSHYYPIACESYFEVVKNVGNKIEYASIPKVNHYFSLNGKIGKGKAFNGCSNNIILINSDGSMKHRDGSDVGKKGWSKCFTRESGKGKARQKLNEAINLALDFFDKNSNS